MVLMLDARAKPSPAHHSPTRRLPADLATAAGLTVFAAAYTWLILTGHTRISSSTDPGAARISLWTAALPALAAIAVARLTPSAARPPEPGRRTKAEAAILVACATAMAVTAFTAGHGLAHIGLKLVFLLAVPLLAFRLLHSGKMRLSTAGRLAAVPAVALWFVLSQLTPLRTPLTDDLPDPVTLVIGSLITLLTASVLEEVFYRRWLQTRLEAQFGRWPGILAAALLFAAMHSARVEPSEPVLGIATIIAVQGMFGLLLGYLWSRFRTMWTVIIVHVVTNLVFVPMLADRLLP